MHSKDKSYPKPNLYIGFFLTCWSDSANLFKCPHVPSVLGITITKYTHKKG